MMHAAAPGWRRAAVQPPTAAAAPVWPVWPVCYASRLAASFPAPPLQPPQQLSPHRSSRRHRLHSSLTQPLSPPHPTAGSAGGAALRHDAQPGLQILQALADTRLVKVQDLQHAVVQEATDGTPPAFLQHIQAFYAGDRYRPNIRYAIIISYRSI